MKKLIMIMLVLFMGTTVVTTSCKKEDKKSEKERVQELLVSGKWYYQIVGGDETADCFDSSDYWEFKADGTSEEYGWSFGGRTYSISEDGKIITLSNGWTISVTSINQSTFKFTVGGDGTYEITLAKTAGNCELKK